MVEFVRVNTNGNFENMKVDKFENLYKKCKFKKNEYFDKCKSFGNIEIWGKSVGKRNKLNSFELFYQENIKIYGDAAIIKVENDGLSDLSLDEWSELYSSLSNNQAQTVESPTTDNIVDINNVEIDIKSEISEIEIPSTCNSDTSEECDSASSELRYEDYVYSSE